VRDTQRPLEQLVAARRDQAARELAEVRDARAAIRRRGSAAPPPTLASQRA